VHPLHHGSALFDTTAALTTQGIALADLTPEAFLHYVWESRDHGLAIQGRSETGRGQFPGQLAWQVLHDMGHFPSGTPATLRAAVLSGRRTVQELVDRYDIRHQGVRQLLLDYLRRREPGMDYSTLDQLSRSSSPESARPNAKAGLAKSKDSPSASLGPTTSLPRSTNAHRSQPRHADHTARTTTPRPRSLVQRIRKRVILA
jgi:hypothetical protein